MYTVLSSALQSLPTLHPQTAKEHYKLIKEDYEKEVQKLTKLVDGAVDSVDFIAASGQSVCLSVCLFIVLLYLPFIVGECVLCVCP